MSHPADKLGNGHMKMNPAEGLQLPKQKRPQEEREIFNDDDLHKIFHSKKNLTS